MHYLVFLLLLAGGFCGAKVIHREGSSGRGSSIPLLPDLPTLHEAPVGPVGDYKEYYRSGLPFPPITPALTSLWRKRSGRRGERSSGRGVKSRIRGERRDRRGERRGRRGDRGGRRGHVSIWRGPGMSSVSRYNPSKYHSTNDYGYYPKPRVYFYPTQYVGHPYGYGFPEFFVSGKRKDPSEAKAEAEAKAKAAAVAKGKAEATARATAAANAAANAAWDFESPWKAMEAAMDGMIPPWESTEGSDNKPLNFAMMSFKVPGEKPKVVTSWDP